MTFQSLTTQMQVQKKKKTTKDLRKKKSI